MAQSEKSFLNGLLKQLALKAYAYAAPHISSKTLRRAMRIVRLSDTATSLYIPHYWALYVHDGRGPFSASAGRYLVWFRDPGEDPRLAGSGGQTPERASQLRHLGPDEFRFWLDQNRIAREEGQQPPMIVVRAVRKGTRGDFFFDNTVGMLGFVDKASSEVAPIVQAWLTSQLKDVQHIKDTAKLRI